MGCYVQLSITSGYFFMARITINLLQTIPMPINAFQLPAVLRQQPELVADAAHIGIDRARSHRTHCSPDCLMDMTARQQSTQVAQEQNREIEILAYKFNNSAISADSTVHAVHPEIIHLEHVILGFHLPCTACHRLNPCQ